MRKLLVVTVALAIQGCAHRTMVITGPGEANRYDVDAVLKANPVGPEEAVKPVRLGADERASFSLVQIRTREKPHLHAAHDLFVNLVRGEGSLLMVKRVSSTVFLCSVVPMRAGDSSFIARGTTHCFINRAGAPSVAFATYTPPFDGTDVVPSLSREVEEAERWLNERQLSLQRMDAWIMLKEGGTSVEWGVKTEGESR